MAITEKYVTTTGDNTDLQATYDAASSSGTPCSLYVALKYAAPGHRINVKSGSYTLSSMPTLTNGTVGSPIIFRGYSSTITDGYQGRSNTNTGTLTTTNFPVITLNNVAMAMGTWNRYECLHITSAYNGTMVTMGAGGAFFRCKITNTHSNGASATAISGSSSYGNMIDCDFSSTSTNTSVVCVDLQRAMMFACRVTCPYGIAVQPILAGAVISTLMYDSGYGISADYNAPVINCSFRNITNSAIRDASTSGTLLVVNCVAWDVKYFIECVSSAKSWISINNAAGSYKTGGARFALQGDFDEIGAITLSSDPFKDAANGDFRLNNTTNAGALCKVAGLWPSIDLGAFQRPEPTLPTQAQTMYGIQYGFDGTEYTGEYVGGVSEDDVRDQVVYGNGYAMGNCVLPPESKVENQYKYGTSGDEFTGSLVSGGLDLPEAVLIGA